MPDDLQYVKLPDGSYGAFPLTMKDEEITAAVGRLYPSKPQETMSAQKPLASRVWESARSVLMDPFKAPEALGSMTSGIENYTQEGRREHPILSRIGDVTKAGKEYAGMLATLAPLIPEGEALRVLRGGDIPGTIVPSEPQPLRAIHRGQLVPAEERAVNAVASPDLRLPPGAPKAPPAVESPFRTEVPGTVQDPTRLGARGRGGVVIQEPKLLAAPKETAAPAEAPAALPRIATPEAEPAAAVPSEEVSQVARDYLRSLGARRQPIAQAPKPSIQEIVNQVAGVKPLERDVPLRQQLRPIPRPVERVERVMSPKEEPAPLRPIEAPAQETDPIKLKYPDPEVRRFVRANGEALVNAVGDDKELLQKLHNLKNVEVREAAVNAGIDLGTKHVGSRTALGPEQISRQELFGRLLEKHSPEEILELAKPKEAVPVEEEQ